MKKNISEVVVLGNMKQYPIIKGSFKAKNCKSYFEKLKRIFSSSEDF